MQVINLRPTVEEKLSIVNNEDGQNTENVDIVVESSSDINEEDYSKVKLINDGIDKGDLWAEVSLIMTSTRRLGYGLF